LPPYTCRFAGYHSAAGFTPERFYANTFSSQKYSLASTEYWPYY